MRTLLVIAGLVALAGCSSRLPKLAVAKGPERYANPGGTILPSLPVPGPEGPRLNAKPSTVPPAPPVHPDLR